MEKNKVTIYTVEWCPHCKRALAFLDSIGAKYENHDVDNDDARWKEALKITNGIDVVPVMKIGNRTRYGKFDSDFEKWIKESLAQAE